MIAYLWLALIKVLDNIISTAKSIATYQERKWISSILVAISQLIFYVMAFSKTKEESTMIDEYLAGTAHRYFKEVLK